MGYILFIEVAWYAFFLHQPQVDVPAWVIDHLLQVILQTAKEWPING